MGCFLGCFGGSKDRRRRKQKNKVIPRDQQRHGGQNHRLIQNVVPTEEGIKKSPPVMVSELLDEPEEQLSSNSKKNVTFDSNVTTYEHVSVFESVESLVGEKEKKDTGVASSNSRSASEDDSVTSSVGSYPPNYRYQNCRDSDDEDGECGDSELEDDEYGDENYSDNDDDVDGRIIGREMWSESVVTESMESRTDELEDEPILEEVDSSMGKPFKHNEEVKAIGPNGYARNRSDYVHPVLNPVENLAQWKTVKTKGISKLKVQKENYAADLEEPLPFSSEPTFTQHSSASLKPKSERKKNSNQELAVDASLSTWLASPEPTPAKTSLGNCDTLSSEKKVISMSQGSNSVRSFDDRPILGALTFEELKQLSAASSPRKSPSRSPDEMPIIGTVGTYWNDSISSKESKSASSYKGIPNTTSKYREDKRVNWHSTPFETRLERALNRGTG